MRLAHHWPHQGMLNGQEENVTTIAHYWHILTPEDKNFIVMVIKTTRPEYSYLHVGLLPFLNLKMVKHAVRSYRASCYHTPMWTNLPLAAYARKVKSTRRRVLSHLSPDLLKRQQARQWRKTNQ